MIISCFLSSSTEREGWPRLNRLCSAVGKHSSLSGPVQLLQQAVNSYEALGHTVFICRWVLYSKMTRICVVMGVFVIKSSGEPASVQLSEPISTSEKPYQMKIFAVRGGRNKGLLEVFFRTKKSVSSVTLLFLKRLLWKYYIVLLGP